MIDWLVVRVPASFPAFFSELARVDSLHGEGGKKKLKKELNPYNANHVFNGKVVKNFILFSFDESNSERQNGKGPRSLCLSHLKTIRYCSCPCACKNLLCG